MIATVIMNCSEFGSEIESRDDVTLSVDPEAADVDATEPDAAVGQGTSESSAPHSGTATGVVGGDPAEQRQSLILWAWT